MSKKSTCPSPADLFRQGRINEIDSAFAELIHRLQPEPDPWIDFAAALSSHVVSQGHVCLDLRHLDELDGIQGLAILPQMREKTLSSWQRHLSDSPVVAGPGQSAPLIWDEPRLYLMRYWHYEHRLARQLLDRCRTDPPEVNPDALKKGLVQWFGTGSEKVDADQQKMAALTAAVNYFALITGGPGTGKTYTLARLIGLLTDLDPSRQLSLLLAAPTGKAAARLQAALDHALSKVAAQRPGFLAHVKAGTIHRLLGSYHGTHRFRHHAAHPLSADVVIVDEASMVDLALMSKLVDAVGEKTRLILTGDPFQLASVEAGAVLDAICHKDVNPVYSQRMAHLAREVAGFELPVEKGAGRQDDAPALQDVMVTLTQNYRFQTQTGLGALIQAVHEGNDVRALDLLNDASQSHVRLHRPARWDDAAHGLAKSVRQGYTAMLTADPGRYAALDRNQFCLMGVHRNGPAGVIALNRFVENDFEKKGLLQRLDGADRSWYLGRPVMVLRNDHGLGLFNGDVGATVFKQLKSGRLEIRVAFETSDGVRFFSPDQLPPHETVFAMTVHKSQGSEFDRIALVLPETDSPLLTRELIYTAVTRARRQVDIWGRPEILSSAIKRRSHRWSGLHRLLWGGS